MPLHDLLLCIPPVGQVNYPYVAVPLLAAVAAARGYAVTVRDLNIDYLNHLIAEEPQFSGERDAGALNQQFLDLGPSQVAVDVAEAFIQSLSNQAAVFGFSLPSPVSLRWAVYLATGIKRINPEALVVFGGAFCDRATAAYVLSQHDAVDVVVIGEGENTLLEIMEKSCSGNLSSFEGVAGVAFSKADRVVINRRRPPLTDLDPLPFPDYSQIPIEDYLNFKLGVRALPILGSRGCVGSCSFCSERAMWGRYRARSPHDVVQEIGHQCQTHDVRLFRFNDSVLNCDLRRLEKICDLLIEADLGITWVGNARVSSKMSRALLQKMYEAGCRVLWYGIESASPRMLRVMKKGIDIEEAPRVLEETRRAGIQVLTFWISNFPGERVADTRKTIEFFREHGKHINFAHFTEFHLHKNSEMSRHPEKFGIEILDRDGFGQPIWRSTREGCRNSQILESVADIYTAKAHLPWVFVGAI